MSRGVLTTYPRAVYMTGHETNISKDIIDNSRFISHAQILTPDGLPRAERRKSLHHHLGLL